MIDEFADAKLYLLKTLIASIESNRAVIYNQLSSEKQIELEDKVFSMLQEIYSFQKKYFGLEKRRRVK